MNNVLFLFLRRMRQPLLVLLMAYSISIAGLVLIPGVDPDGQVWRFDFFHAFYFISITGPTIGFGELPYEFTGGQRMWVTLCIYMTVLSWLYAIGQIFRLLQDPTFIRALNEQRFVYAVRQIQEPFYIVCGYGGTGSLLVRALTRRGIHCVVLDRSQRCIDDLTLEELPLSVPGFCCDAGVVRHLVEAGIKRPNCQGVIAITDSDEANVKIAVSCKLLRPRLKVIARAESDDAVGNLRSFNTDAIINPFTSFAERLGLAIRKPNANLLHAWLGSLPDNPLPQILEPPKGHWILCGYGRFGRAVHKDLADEGIDCSIIEQNENLAPEGAVIGSGVEAAPLRRAGAEDAVGIVAGTNSDANNLSIIMTARELNPDMFLVGRQDLRSNSELFKAARLDLTIETNRIIVWRILAMLTVPLLNRFLALAREKDDQWSKALLAEIRQMTEGKTPETFAQAITLDEAPAVASMLESGQQVELQQICQDARGTDKRLAVIPLLLFRRGETEILPAPETRIETGDRLLFCAAPDGARGLRLNLHSDDAMHYVVMGSRRGQGSLFRWLERRKTAANSVS